MSLRSATDKPTSPGGTDAAPDARPVDTSMAGAMERLRALRGHAPGTDDSENPLRRPTTSARTPGQGQSGILGDQPEPKSGPPGPRETSDDDDDDVFAALDPEPSGDLADDAGDTEETDDDPVVWKDEHGAPVKRSEAKSGYMRRKAFSQKTEEVARHRQVLEQEVAQTQAARQSYVQLLGTLQQQAQEAGPKAPDERLKALDPMGYDQQVTAYLLHNEQMRLRHDEMMRVAQEHQMTGQRQFEERRREEQTRMIEAIPTLKRVANDPAKLSATMQRYRQGARMYGYSDEELSRLVDHRAIVLLDHAMRWRAGERRQRNGGGKGNTTTNGATAPSVGPEVTLKGTTGRGTSVNGGPPSNRKISEAEANFRKTGKMGDALGLLRARREARTQRR